MKSRVVGWWLFLLLSCAVLIIPVAAQQASQKPASSPLVQLLQAKGILNAEEVAEVSQASSPSEADKRLAQLLVDKGLISEQEYKATYTNTAVSMPTEFSTARLMNAVYSPQTVSQPQAGQQPGPTQATTKAPEAPFIPAVAPVRVLPIDVPKQAGMIPDIKLGSGANMKIYGFYKATAVSDTASSGGPTFGSNDFPLPLLLADTGPTSDPQVHLKARSFRIGMQSEWVPKGSDFTITGRVEGDFEGDYTDVNNRNISSVRNGQFSLRLAWVRVDHKLGTLPWFAEFGQDWSILGSSTLPSLLETTGLGIGMGSLYERMPQFKTGIQFPAGDLKIQPEFAIVLPVAASSALTADQRLRFGDRAGAESNQPGLEARIVFQFPLSHAKGVPPAQLIFSGHHARINEIIPGARQVLPTGFVCISPCTVPAPTVFNNPGVPNIGFTAINLITGASNCSIAAGCNLAQFFPRGIQLDNPQNIYTGEIQLPTPWVTLVAKFYRGNDMRFFFAGQLNDVFSNLHGLVSVGSGISFSGRSISFGCAGRTVTGTSATTGAEIFHCPGTPVLPAILQPVGGSGGFAELSFPLSRIFHADPAGLNSGWVLHVQYSTDRANYADARQGNSLGRTDLDTASLTYRLNRWVTFIHEASYIVTRTASGSVPRTLPFAGLQTHQAHNWRNEFGPVFTF